MNFYKIIGPAVWTAAILFILLSIFRMRKSTMYSFAFTVFILGVRIWIDGNNYIIDNSYYLSQNIAFALLFVLAGIVHRMIIVRHNKISTQYANIVSSEKKLTILNRSLELKINENIQTLDALKISENNFKTIFHKSADPVFLLRAGRFIDCNSAALEALNYASKQELINKYPWDISPEIQPDGTNSKDKAKQFIK